MKFDPAKLHEIFDAQVAKDRADLLSGKIVPGPMPATNQRRAPGVRLLGWGEQFRAIWDYMHDWPFESADLSPAALQAWQHEIARRLRAIPGCACPTNWLLDCQRHPCPTDQSHGQSWLREAIFAWTVEAHNRQNRLNGKLVIGLDQARALREARLTKKRAALESASMKDRTPVDRAIIEH